MFVRFTFSNTDQLDFNIPVPGLVVKFTDDLQNMVINKLQWLPSMVKKLSGNIIRRIPQLYLVQKHI